MIFIKRMQLIASYNKSTPAKWANTSGGSFCSLPNSARVSNLSVSLLILNSCIDEFSINYSKLQPMVRPHLLLPILLLMAILPHTASFSLGSCSVFSLDGTRCEQCIANYHPYDGKCYVDILGCKAYNFGNICLECQNEYILVNNYCCDRICISQMYRQQDPLLGVTQVLQQSQVLQNLLK